jgi:3-hydroxyacyl-CoA dehydrogenase
MTPSASTVSRIARVGVVGPGLMGLGISQTLAAAGVDVVLCGRDLAASEAGRDRLAASLRRQVAKGRLAASDETAVLARVKASRLTSSALAGSDLVIESVPEDRTLKTKILAEISEVAPRAILATNTSGLAIGGLAEALVNPAKFVGLHFFSPAERMQLVEVVRGPQTSAETTAAAICFLAFVGKRPILVRDGPGFFTTRVFAAYLDEAAALVAEGVAAETIETAAISNGRALGPLAMLDETGVALNLSQARQARADGLEERFCRVLAEPVLARLVAEGRCGRRSGGGFYDWPVEGSRSIWPGLHTVFPIAAKQPETSLVRFRLLAAEAREALRCLEEGVIASADDADVASVLGLGYPSRIGGVLRWAEDLGLADFVAECERLANSFGERFLPSSWLLDVANRSGGLANYRKTEKSA